MPGINADAAADVSAEPEPPVVVELDPTNLVVLQRLGDGFGSYAGAAGGPGRRLRDRPASRSGRLVTEHGSVATMLAGELAGTRAYERRLVPVVAVALALATILLYASSGM
jgi:hypothetical protein